MACENVKYDTTQERAILFSRYFETNVCICAAAQNKITSKISVRGGILRHPPHRVRAHLLCGSGRPMSSRIYFTNLSKEDNIVVASSIVAETSAT